MQSNRCTRTTYKIQVQGELDQDWEAWFNGFDIDVDSSKDRLPTSTITALVTDQSALRGILNKLWDLNLVLISVQRIEMESQKERKQK